MVSHAVDIQNTVGQSDTRECNRAGIRFMFWPEYSGSFYIRKHLVTSNKKAIDLFTLDLSFN